MISMTIKEFVTLTGAKRSSLNRRLDEIGAVPVGHVAVTTRHAYKWLVQDLEKALSLIGTRIRSGRPRDE